MDSLFQRHLGHLQELRTHSVLLMADAGGPLGSHALATAAAAAPPVLPSPTPHLAGEAASAAGAEPVVAGPNQALPHPEAPHSPAFPGARVEPEPCSDGCLELLPTPEEQQQLLLLGLATTELEADELPDFGLPDMPTHEAHGHPLLPCVPMGPPSLADDGGGAQGQEETTGRGRGRALVVHMHGNPLFAGEGEEPPQEGVLPGSHFPGLGVPSLPVL